MAKRRKLEAPSAADLDKMEDQFRRETSRRSPAAAAPIAQVAADSAAALAAQAEQESNAADRRDAKALREAKAQGRVMLDIPLDEIKADAIIRDRAVIRQDELNELQNSILTSGLRLPIEVFALEGAEEGAPRYGLLSGYRRLIAMRHLRDVVKDPKAVTIKAILRDTAGEGVRFASMVEENEIRAALSHFERGRIAVIAAQQGAFANTEAAVDAMFGAASKAKRSKIRSFSLIFEELGDLLKFPEALKERDGLRLATALRNGGEGDLREALTAAQPSDPAEEWGLIEKVLPSHETHPAPPSRGGRPRKSAEKKRYADNLVLKNGIQISQASDSKGYTIRITGDGVDQDVMDGLVFQLRYLLEKSE